MKGAGCQGQKVWTVDNRIFKQGKGVEGELKRAGKSETCQVPVGGPPDPQKALDDCLRALPVAQNGEVQTHDFCRYPERMLSWSPRA